ncbi:MAG: hypothetical protein FJW92_06335 [Actinobacteria bacterium]|nr:hypothetical protein [Actinomycetota bacterium]
MPMDGVSRRRAACAAIRRDLSDLEMPGATRGPGRRDRLGFAFDDGGTLLVHWYAARAGLPAGEFVTVLNVSVDGVPAGHAHRAALGSLGDPPGGPEHFIVHTDDDCERVGAALAAIARARWIPDAMAFRDDPRRALRLLAERRGLRCAYRTAAEAALRALASGG